MTTHPIWSPPEGVDMTAVGAALMRARHLLVDGEPKVFKDDFAARLLGVPESVVRGPVPGVPVPTGNKAIAAAWVLRSRYAEDCLKAARERGVTQYVILGAGLDSFALRHAASPSDLTVFEVDAPRTQEWKRKRLAELGIETPKNLRFAPCNFERTSLAVALAGAAFRSDEPAFLSWLGVTQYLTRGSIDVTLRWAARLAPGSELVLTFVPPSPEMIETGTRISAATGANFATFFTPEKMTATLRTAGFAEAEHFSPELAQRTYFDGRSDGLSAPNVEQLMRARNAAPTSRSAA